LVALVGRARELSLLLVLAAIVFGVWLRAPHFISSTNLRQILLSVSIIAIVAVGQTLVVLTRNVDLSVASTVGLVAYVVRDLLRDHPGFSIALAIALGLLIGAGLGAVNGLLVTAGGVPAIVATLGTLYVYRGITFAVGGGDLVTGSEVPRAFRQLAQERPLGVPAPIWVTVVVAIVVGYALHATRPGRGLYAVGSNPDAARLTGLRRERLVFGAFVCCGLLAGLGGVIWGARFPSIDARAATGLELQVVAAVVLGGVNIFGGSGTVFGAVLGAVLLGTISNALTILRVNQLWIDAFAGAAIIVAVALDAVINRRLQRALQARRRR
jgi:rhamnose transport system permease protein